MIELGRRQKLQVVKKVEFGVYLGEKADAKEQERVLLPAKQVPAETKVGDELEVFIYRDSADRLIATTRVPALELHQTAVVKVAEVGKIGAFLDWGLEKDLLLRYKEQTVKVKKDQEVLVALYIDKSDRLCATLLRSVPESDWYPEQLRYRCQTRLHNLPSVQFRSANPLLMWVLF